MTSVVPDSRGHGSQQIFADDTVRRDNNAMKIRRVSMAPFEVLPPSLHAFGNILSLVP
jgi:hypothetical protein